MKSSENEENMYTCELKFLKNLHQRGRIAIFSYSLPGLMLFLYFVPSDMSCARVVCCVSSLFSDMITLREAEDMASCLLQRFRQTFAEETATTLLMLLSYAPWGEVPMH